MNSSRALAGGSLWSLPSVFVVLILMTLRVTSRGEHLRTPCITTSAGGGGIPKEIGLLAAQSTLRDLPCQMRSRRCGGP